MIAKSGINKLKHGRRLCCGLLLLLAGLIPNKSMAQDEIQTSFSWTTFLGRNFNPGIKVGVGGAQPHYYWPALSVRIGPLSLTGVMYDPIIDNRAFSYQGDLDLFGLKQGTRLLGMKSHFGLSGGLIKTETFTDLGRNTYVTLFGLAGINRYADNMRGKFSLKVGTAYLWTNKDITRYRDVETHDWIPYGELSYTMYLFKIRNKQRFKTPESDSANYLAHRKNVRESTPPKHPTLSRWFNPYWSWGVGLDRVYFTPAGGVRIGNFSGKFSAWFNDVEGFFGLNLNYEFLLRSSGEYSKYFSAGALLNARSGDDGMSSSSTSILGLVGGYTFLQNHGRHSIEFKAGIGNLQRVSSNHFGDPEDHTRSRSTKWIPVAGISYNLHFFRFVN